MSDYVHKKVIRYPFPQSIFDICGADNVYDNKVEEYLKNKTDNKFGSMSKSPYFDTEYTDSGNIYLDYVVDYTYGEECGDWGYATYLTEKQKDKAIQLFKDIVPAINPELFRKVDYCWYNCCEPEDVYEVEPKEEEDWF